MFIRWLQKWAARRRPPTTARQPERTAIATAQASAAQSAASDVIHQRYLQMLLATEAPSTASLGASEKLDQSAPEKLSLSVPEKLVRQVVEQQLRNGELRRAAVPRLPTVIPLLLKQLRDPNASARDYVAIIRQDPVVAAAVLSFANSAYFNPYRKAVDNFEAAVATLGINGLRLVLSTAVLQPIVRGRGDNLPQRVWDQSFACAICCQQLAERANLDSFKAYLCGLVHNIGVVTIYNQTQQQGQQHLPDARPSINLLLQLIEQWAQSLTYWIAQDWQLPTEIVRALAAQGEKTASSDAALAVLLVAASRLSEAYMLERAGHLQRAELAELAAALGFEKNILTTLDDALTDILVRK